LDRPGALRYQCSFAFGKSKVLALSNLQFRILQAAHHKEHSHFVSQQREAQCGNKMGVFFVVDPTGFEPVTSSMPWRRSTN
jgi:hypothetical protein